MRKRASKRGTLFLAIGKLARRVTEHVVDLEKPGRRRERDHRSQPGARRAPSADWQYSQGREMRKQRKVLECHADVLVRGIPDMSKPSIASKPSDGCSTPAMRRRENGLPGSRWAENHQDLAGLDRERQIFQNLIVAK